MTGPRIPRDYPSAAGPQLPAAQQGLGPDVPDLLRALALAAIPVILAWLTKILARQGD